MYQRIIYTKIRKMNIIKYLLCWLKALFTVLPYEDFIFLCDGVDKENSKIAEYALKAHLSRLEPDKSVMERICAGSPELKLDYLQSIRPNRRVSDYEQLCMVRHIPIGGRYCFPSPLREPALNELFERSSAQKLGDYAARFALPADYELRLIDLCHKEKNPHLGLNTYRRALHRYLAYSYCKRNILASPAAQLAVLALDNEMIALDMVRNCTFAKNILFLPVQEILVEQGTFATLQELLFHSFIDSDELAEKMLQRFPQLKWMFEISRLRKPLYRIENELDTFWGIQAPSLDEMHFIEEIIKSAPLDAEQQKMFVQHKVKPLLDMATPYFCAWVAYKFPELGEQAYQQVRKFAEHCRDLHKKKK